MIVSSKCTVKSIKEINETLKLITFEIEKYVPWEPGMFLQLSLDKYDPSEPWPNSRAFSFASYGDKEAKILVRKTGEFTTRLFKELRKNDEFYIRYCFGDFILSEPGDKVFIAAGTGVSVFLSYIDYYIKKQLNEKVFLFHSIRNSKELIRNYLEVDIPEKIEIFSFITKERIRGFPNRRIEIEDIMSNISQDDNYSFYICGNDEFVEKYAMELKTKNIDAIYTESWDKSFIQ